MHPRGLALAPALVIAALALTGCGPGAGGPAENPNSTWLADNLDLDSYHAEGTVDGLTWTGELCALNLIPSFSVYFEGKDDPYYSLYFEAADKDIAGGVVTGIWRLDGDVNHVVQINKGTWSNATAADAHQPGTIALALDVTEHLPAGGSTQRSVSGTLNLTPVITSEECLTMNDPDYLKDALKTYGGPTGDGM